MGARVIIRLSNTHGYLRIGIGEYRCVWVPG